MQCLSVTFFRPLCTYLTITPLWQELPGVSLWTFCALSIFEWLLMNRTPQNDYWYVTKLDKGRCTSVFLSLLKGKSVSLSEDKGRVLWLEVTERGLILQPSWFGKEGKACNLFWHLSFEKNPSDWWEQSPFCNSYGDWKIAGRQKNSIIIKIWTQVVSCTYFDHFFIYFNFQTITFSELAPPIWKHWTLKKYSHLWVVIVNIWIFWSAHQAQTINVWPTRVS